jgi:hypothetical protein
MRTKDRNLLRRAVLSLVYLTITAQEKYSIGGVWTLDSERHVDRPAGGINCDFTESVEWTLVINHDDTSPHELTIEKDVDPSARENHTTCLLADSFHQKIEIRVPEFRRQGNKFHFEGRIRDCRGCDDDGKISRGRDLSGTASLIGDKQLKLSLPDLGEANLTRYEAKH